MDITKADIRPWDGIGMEENGNYSVGYECWFDVDEYLVPRPGMTLTAG